MGFRNKRQKGTKFKKKGNLNLLPRMSVKDDSSTVYS